jgi:hypothetical protein
MANNNIRNGPSLYYYKWVIPRQAFLRRPRGHESKAGAGRGARKCRSRAISCVLTYAIYSISPLHCMVGDVRSRAPAPSQHAGERAAHAAGPSRRPFSAFPFPPRRPALHCTALSAVAIAVQCSAQFSTMPCAQCPVQCSAQCNSAASAIQRRVQCSGRPATRYKQFPAAPSGQESTDRAKQSTTGVNSENIIFSEVLDRRQPA